MNDWLRLELSASSHHDVSHTCDRFQQLAWLMQHACMLSCDQATIRPSWSFDQITQCTDTTHTVDYKWEPASYQLPVAACKSHRDGFLSLVAQSCNKHLQVLVVLSC